MANYKAKLYDRISEMSLPEVAQNLTNYLSDSQCEDYMKYFGLFPLCDSCNDGSDPTTEYRIAHDQTLCDACFEKKEYQHRCAECEQIEEVLNHVSYSERLCDVCFEDWLKYNK